MEKKSNSIVIVPLSNAYTQSSYSYALLVIAHENIIQFSLVNWNGYLQNTDDWWINLTFTVTQSLLQTSDEVYVRFYEMECIDMVVSYSILIWTFFGRNLVYFTKECNISLKHQYKCT